MHIPFFFLFSVVKKSLFTKISELHLDQIKKINLTDTFIIHSKINSIDNNKYYFSNYYFRKVLINYSTTNNNEEFHSTFYPSYDFDAPILAINLVNIDNSNKSLCFINLVEIYNRKEYFNYYIKPFHKIKKLYPDFIQIKPNDILQSKYLKIFLNKDTTSIQQNIYLNKFINTIILFDYLENSKIDSVVYNIIQNYFDIYSKMFLKRPVNRYFITERHLEYEEIIKKITINDLN
jgi:hypothetical protein